MKLRTITSAITSILCYWFFMAFLDFMGWHWPGWLMLLMAFPIGALAGWLHATVLYKKK